MNNQNSNFTKNKNMLHSLKVLSLLFLASAGLFTSCKKELKPGIQVIPEASAVHATSIVNTLAGSTQGFKNSTALESQFDSVSGVAVDSVNNVYVADTFNHRIRKITPAGLVTTLAGNGFTDANGNGGFADGPGIMAQFNYPVGIAVDGLGNVYVGDQKNHRIRKITKTGLVSTLAGSGFTGVSDATGPAAEFNMPSGVAVDKKGNVYVADYFNHRIRKINPASVVSTLAGNIQGFANGTGMVAMFNHPIGIAVDLQGNVYTGDQGNHMIRKITPTGETTTLAGSGIPGFLNASGTSAQFNTPSGVAVSLQGNVYVSDSFNHKIRKITPAGMVSTVAGSTKGFKDAAVSTAKFDNPWGLAVSAQGTIYVGDQGNHKIRRLLSLIPAIN